MKYFVPKIFLLNSQKYGLVIQRKLIQDPSSGSRDLKSTRSQMRTGLKIKDNECCYSGFALPNIFNGELLLLLQLSPHVGFRHKAFHQFLERKSCHCRASSTVGIWGRISSLNQTYWFCSLYLILLCQLMDNSARDL